MTFKITALKVQKRNTQRVNVFLDGEFAFGLSRIVAAWLQIGQELSEEEIALLKSKENYEAAFQQALKLLNYRQRSEAEVRKNLEEHQFLEVVIVETIERLRRSGLLNDQRFAQNWVENRSEFRPRSRRALQAELRQRGLAEEAIAEALEAVDDEELAYQAACKQARKYRESEWPDFRVKMTNFLARRGFRYDSISNAVKRVWEEQYDETYAPDIEEESE
jgi:regulatory protein